MLKYAICSAALIVLAGCRSEFDDALQRAEAGSITDQVRVAEMYRDGIGVPIQEGKALYWFYRAAIRGDSKSQRLLSRYYSSHRLESDEETGEIVEYEDISSTAFNWALKASKGGDDAATALVAEYYLKGIGVDKNEQAAYQILSNALDRRHPAVLYQLGMMRLDGKGASQDSALGIKLISEAAQQGYVEAHAEYCYLLEEGEHVQFDPKGSFRCFLQVASKDPDYARNVAERYAFGHGVDQDSVLAYAWYLVMEENSDIPMNANDKHKFKIVKNRLSIFEIFKAKLLALNLMKSQKI